MPRRPQGPIKAVTVLRAAVDVLLSNGSQADAVPVMNRTTRTLVRPASAAAP
jgi:hypothetical protein